MKIYLSEYWIKNCLFTLFLTFAVVTGTVWFCFLYQVKEYYLFIVGVTLYIIIVLFLIRTSLLFVRYVVKEGDQMVMYSFRKKRIASLNSDLNIYYEVISLTEGMYSKKEFIILSNMPFKSFQTCYCVTYLAYHVIYNTCFDSHKIASSDSKQRKRYRRLG